MSRRKTSLLAQSSVESFPGPVRDETTLCVDLDGTLIHSDLLYESLLALLAKQPLLVFLLPFWLLRGKAHVKEQIARRTSMDFSSLPYNRPLLDFLQEQHRQGRELVLATATHRILAEQLAAHLGIFSRVLATENGVNLAGKVKCSGILRALGEKKFDYAANGRVDLEVWSHARQIILVNAPADVEAEARAMGQISRVYEAGKPSLKTYLAAMRPHQWAKNALIFIPAMAAHALTDLATLGNTLLAFVAFSLCASAIYIANDLADLEADRSHVTKQLRPFASGAIPLLHGMIMSPTLLVIGFGLALFLPAPFILVLAGYLVTTIAYTIDLKQRVMVDVLTLAGLYTFRLLAGSAATGIALSTWLLAFSMFLFLSLALVKRYSELHDLAAAGSMKIKGRGYRVHDLPLIESLGTSSGYLAVLVLALYVSSDDIHILYENPSYLWGLCLLLLYWISRTWMIAHRGRMHQDPVVFALTDKNSLIILGLCAAVIAVATTDFMSLVKMAWTP